MSARLNHQLLWVTLVATLSGGAAGVLGVRFFAGWVTPFYPAAGPVAVIDPLLLIDEQLQHIEPGQTTSALQARGQAYARQLDRAIAQVARDYHVTLLVKPAVLSPAPDLTDAVRRQIHAAP